MIVHAVNNAYSWSSPRSWGSRRSSTPLIAEDLLLLLFDPRSGTIAGEGTLFYTLAGAVLADLAVGGHIEVDEDTTLTGRRVRAVAAAPPSDPLLREPWDRLTRKPRTAQVLLAEIGPTLRDPLLDRLVLAGHIGRERGRFSASCPPPACPKVAPRVAPTPGRRPAGADRGGGPDATHGCTSGAALGEREPAGAAPGHPLVRPGVHPRSGAGTR